VEKGLQKQVVEEKEIERQNKGHILTHRWNGERKIAEEMERYLGTSDKISQAAVLSMYNSVHSMRVLTKEEIEDKKMEDGWVEPPKFAVRYFSPDDDEVLEETCASFGWAKDNFRPKMINEVINASKGQLETEDLELPVPSNIIAIWEKQTMAITAIEVSGLRTSHKTRNAVTKNLMFRYAIRPFNDIKAQWEYREIKKEDLEKLVNETETKLVELLIDKLDEKMEPKKQDSHGSVRKSVYYYKFTIEQDAAQICALRYLDTDGGTFRGKIHDPVLKQFRVITLPRKWVKGNFPKYFVEEVKKSQSG
jgi:hypothetical protein